MSEEHVRLVAKIQHFYDLMLQRLRDVEDSELTVIHDGCSAGEREKIEELEFLAYEYAKTFENFLYKESAK